jgi:hypothetical protein
MEWVVMTRSDVRADTCPSPERQATPTNSTIGADCPVGTAKVPQRYALMTSDEIGLHRGERKRLSSSYKLLLNEISAILFRHDPIGINFADNTDEYDPEAGTILPRLRRDLSAEEATAIIHEEFVRWFEPEITGSRERYSAIAAEILTAYQKWAKSVG